VEEELNAITKLRAEATASPPLPPAPDDPEVDPLLLPPPAVPPTPRCPYFGFRFGPSWLRKRPRVAKARSSASDAWRLYCPTCHRGEGCGNARLVVCDMCARACDLLLKGAREKDGVQYSPSVVKLTQWTTPKRGAGCLRPMSQGLEWWQRLGREARGGKVRRVARGPRLSGGRLALLIDSMLSGGGALRVDVPKRASLSYTRHYTSHLRGGRGREMNIPAAATEVIPSGTTDPPPPPPVWLAPQSFGTLPAADTVPKGKLSEVVRKHLRASVLDWALSHPGASLPDFHRRFSLLAPQEVEAAVAALTSERLLLASHETVPFATDPFPSLLSEPTPLQLEPSFSVPLGALPRCCPY